MSEIAIQAATRAWREETDQIGYAAPTVSGAFVGRQREMQSLQNAVAEALGGSARLVLISGGAGVGKTRLVEELATHAEASGMAAVTVRCCEPASSPCFPWQCALRLCGFARASAQPGVSDRGQFLEVQTGCVAESGPVRARSDLYVLAQAIAEQIARASVERPLLLMLEDVHGWDENSLLVLRFIGREIKRLPLLIITTYRESALRACDSKRSILASLADRAHMLALGDLAEPFVRELITSLTGTALGQPVVSKIMRATGGNPALIRHAVNLCWEPARDADEEGMTAGEQAIMSSRIRDAVRTHLADLSVQSRRVLEIASVLGPDFEFDVLCRAANLSEDRLAEILDELGAAGVVESRREQFQCYRFRQELVREVLYCDISPPARAALHKRTAQVLQDLYGGCESRAGDIVRHSLKSADAQAALDAVVTARAAASVAIRERDFQRAAGFYERALEAVRLLPKKDQSTRCDLLISLGEAQGKAGWYRRAEATLHAAAELAENLGDPRRIGKAALAVPWTNWFAPGSSSGLAMILCEKALAGIGRDDSALRAMLFARLAAESCHVPGRTERAEPLIGEALGIGRAGCDSSTLINILLYRDIVLEGPQSVSERLSNASEILDLARETGSRSALYLGYFARLLSFLELGEIDQADATAKSMKLAAEMSRQPAQLLCASFFGAQRALMEGRFDEGESRIRECVTFAAEHGLREFSNLYWPAMLVPFREKRTNENIEHLAEETLKHCPTAGLYRALLSRIYLHLGKDSEAHFHFERLSADDYAQLPGDGSFLASAAALAELCAEFSDRRRAERLYSLIEPYASRNAIFGIVVVLGPISFYLGRLAATLGELERAHTHFRDALRMSRKLGLRPLAAYSAFQLASRLAARPEDSARARNSLTEVLKESRALGMHDLEAKVLTMLESLAPDVAAESTGGAESAQSNGAHGQREARLTGQLAMSQDSESRPEDAAALHRSTAKADEQVPHFQQEGEFWTLGYQAQLVRLKNAKGLTMMALLLAHPRRQFHASDIAHPGRTAAGDDAAEFAACSDAGPVLDATAKSSYRARLRDLRADLEEARSFNDTLRAARIQEEMAFLTRELARALGLYGKDRRAISDTERARVRVTHAIKGAIAKISQHHPTLGKHLSRSIKTGIFCSYDP